MYKKHRDVLELDICGDENLNQPLQPLETDSFELDDGDIRHCTTINTFLKWWRKKFHTISDESSNYV